MDIQSIVVSLLPILIAITFHEVAHGFVANKLGDPTARLMGRLTLNPIVHIDLVGTIIMPIMLFILTDGRFVFGYAKPVPINPMNFKNPKKGMAISASAGPATNIILAIISQLVLTIFINPAIGLQLGSFSAAVLRP
ncbi:MAG TPA: site-2 protease family protein, partial [Nitrospirae bacterium]|nr:site-2 protease family protein [Nitrospirota bacterium]